MNLTTNEALLLQQIHEYGEESPQTLSKTLRLSRKYVMKILQKMKKKGLVDIDGSYNGIWIHLTKKGNRLINQIWPESSYCLT